MKKSLLFLTILFAGIVTVENKIEAGIVYDVTHPFDDYEYGFYDENGNWHERSHHHWRRDRVYVD